MLAPYHAVVTTDFIEVPGGRLHVVDEGDGPPIVLLHAGIANLRSWDAMVPLLVGAGYRVVRYDQRGFGESTTEDVAFSNRADVIAVLDSLGIGRAALVGNSRGGVIAFDTAAEFPARVVAVIGVAAGLGRYEAPATPAEIAQIEEMERLEEADPPDIPAIADFMVRFWVDGLGQPTDRVPSAIREAVREQEIGNSSARLRQRATHRPRTARERATGRHAHADPRGRGHARRVRRGRGPPAISRRTRPDARAVIWDDVAHMIGMEQPERLASLIVDVPGAPPPLVVVAAGPTGAPAGPTGAHKTGRPRRDRPASNR